MIFFCAKDNNREDTSIDYELKLRFLYIKVPYINNFTKVNKDYMYYLKGKVMNDLPMISAFLKGGIYTLSDINMHSDKIDYQFNIAKECIKFDNGRPLRVITHSISECRYYYNKNIVVINIKESDDINGVLSIVSLLPYCALLKSSPELGYKYIKPEYHTVNLKPDQMELLKTFVFNRLIIIKTELGYRVQGSFEVCNEDMNEKQIDANCKLLRNRDLQFSYKDNLQKKHKFLLKNDGEVASAFKLDTNVLDYIGNVIYIIENPTKLQLPKEDINIIIEEYFSLLHNNITEEIKKKHKLYIVNELKQLIKFGLKEKCESVSLDIINFNIFFNVLMGLCCGKNQKQYIDKFSIEPMEYESLSNFLTVYFKKKLDIILKETDIKKCFSSLVDILREGVF